MKFINKIKEKIKKDKLKKIMPVFLVVLLLTLVTGLTYAIWNKTLTSSVNTITSGVVSMSFTESSNVITINNALPMSDSEGKVLTNYFDFTVTSNLAVNNGDPSAIVNYSIELETLTKKEKFYVSDEIDDEDNINTCVNYFLTLMGVSEGDDDYQDEYDYFSANCQDSEFLQDAIDNDDGVILYLLKIGVIEYDASNKFIEYTVKDNLTEEQINSCALYLTEDYWGDSLEDEWYEEDLNYAHLICSGNEYLEFQDMLDDGDFSEENLSDLVDMGAVEESNDSYSLKDNLSDEVLGLCATYINETVWGNTSDDDWYEYSLNNARLICSGISSLQYNLNNYDFSYDLVGYTSAGAITHEQTVADSGYDALEDDQIKVYLEDITNETSEVVEPTLVSNLSDSTNGKLLYSNMHKHSYGVNTITTKYRLRAWIDYDVDASRWNTLNKYEYKFRININSDTDELLSEKTFYKTVANSVKTTLYNISYQYINDAKENINNVIYNDGDNGVFLYNGTDDNEGDKNIYYYRGAVTNNNVVFGKYCWKIVRTTSTGGTKLIYNGEAEITYDKELDVLEESEYKIESNGGFIFDSVNKKWIDDMNNIMIFTIDNPDNLEYYLNFVTSSSDEGYRYANIYVDDILFSTYYGTNGIVRLGKVNSNNKIKVSVSYYNGSNRTGEFDNSNASFYVSSVPNDANIISYSCEDTILNFTSSYNYRYQSISGVGYMYNNESFDWNSLSISDRPSTDVYYYGNDVTYENGIYTLIDTTTSKVKNWATDKNRLANGYHYTCFSNDTSCSQVYYLNIFDDDDDWHYYTFENGKKLETFYDDMFSNEQNSLIKDTVDNWYNRNLTDYSSYLENTIFCNDRSFASGSLSGTLSSKNSSTRGFYYSAYERLNVNYNPSLICVNQRDRFSLSTASGGTYNYGNNTLIYPVGLITADEVSLAGGASEENSNYYLYTGDDTYWTMTPSYYQNGGASDMFWVLNGKLRGNYYIRNNFYVRPVISLKYGTKYISGDGSASNPYVALTN